MLELTKMEAFDKAIFHGFTVKKGFWYGTDTETGQYIVTSGWECNGCVAVYFKNEDSWNREWVDIEENEFMLHNVPEVKLNEKMSFAEWLENVLGIDREAFDENYDGDSEYEEYEEYLYDGLPKFAREFLKNI